MQAHAGQVCAFACFFACCSKARRAFNGAEATTHMCARATFRSQDVKLVARTIVPKTLSW